MSLAFFIGIMLAMFVESLFLGTILLYLVARWLKAPDINLKRAAGLCVALNVVLAVAGLSVLTIGRTTSSPSFAVLALVICIAGCVGLPWYITKRVLRTGWWRSLGVWIGAWVPLALVNMVFSAVTTLFIMETFILPTGPMAPTVAGAHADRVCPNCGCTFAVSLSNWVRRDDLSERDKWPVETYCPNCREPHVVDNKAVLLRGDHLLADKTMRPDRWSVAAFRSPRKREEKHVSRIVGLPGETIELVSGDVFIDGKRSRKEPHVATDLWVAVHDTALVPQETVPSTPLWRPHEESSRWHRLGGPWIVKDETGGRDLLKFTGRITSSLACNDYDFEEREREHAVGDVLVLCEIGGLRGAGGLGFEWSFGDASMRAEVTSAGKVIVEAGPPLQAANMDRARATGQCQAPIAAGDSFAFAIRDGQAYVVHNGELVALALFGPDEVESARDIPEPEAGCQIAISAADCSVVLNRITIHREVYYLGTDLGSDPLRAGTGAPLQLGDNEYFMLGDNSARSLDSRFFGVVPTNDIVGVVRWIYWPKSRWHELR